MNENVDLTKILKDCPKGFKLYSPLFGEVVFEGISDDVYPIALSYTGREAPVSFTKEGFYYYKPDTECLLFPSKEQRDWSKFEAPWYKKGKKDRFDPKTLKPYDKVLVRDEIYERWKCDFFSYINDDNDGYPYIVTTTCYKHCIPYNDDTKHLVGTDDKAPEYYK